MTPASIVRARAALAAALVLAGCQPRRTVERAPVRLPVSVLADTGLSVRLAVRPPADSAALPAGAHVWLARVAPARPRADDLSLPQPIPDTLGASEPAPPPLAIEDDLKPPIPRGAARLTLPAGVPPGTVELDVRVDETGAVSDALWAAGSEEPGLIRAAITCALAMRFFPALRDDRPVAVWCRQRFDFSARSR